MDPKSSDCTWPITALSQVLTTMTALTDPVLMYFTKNLSDPEKASLVNRINQPNRQYTAPYNLPDSVIPCPFSAEQQVGKTPEEVHQLHRQWLEQTSYSLDREHATTFFVVDDRFAHDESVLIGYLPDETSTKCEFLRAPIDEAISAYTIMDGGQQGWDDLKEMVDSKSGLLFGHQE